MDHNLRDALQGLSNAPRIGPDPVPTDRVLSRIRRGRAVRGVATGALAAVLVGGAAAALTLPHNGARPVQGPEPTPSATRTSAPVPRPTATPTPTPPAVPSPVALTAAGELAELDPVTGAAVRTIASDPEWSGRVALSPDRTYAYVTALGDPADSQAPEVQRVTLANGAVTTVASPGQDPAVSPDGTSLAYVAVDSSGVASLEIMDLATGAVITVAPDQGPRAERVLVNPTWTPDSSAIVVGQGWADELPRVSLWEIEPRLTSTLEDGRRLDRDDAAGLARDWDGAMAFTTDGALLAPAEEGTADQWDAMAAWAFGDGTAVNLPTSLVATLDLSTGTVTGRVAVPGVAWAVAASPGGGQDAEGATTLILVGERGSAEPAALYRLDGTTLTHLADGFTGIGW